MRKEKNRSDLELDFVIENLMELVRDNGELLIGIKYEAEDLLQDLYDFNAFFKQASYGNENIMGLKDLVKKIRWMVNAAGDAIDKFVIRAKIHADKGIWKFLDITYYKRVREVAVEITCIRDRLKEIRRNQSYGLESLGYEDPFPSGLERKPPVVEEDDVVGFDEEVEKIIHRLFEGSDSLEVIPVVGMTGLGKTTIANKVFKDPKVGYEFFTRIWIYVSQSYKRRELFLNIISKFTRNTKQYHDLSEKDLADVIQDFLGKGGKYLVVLDDVWSGEAWERLKIAFPNNKKSNRVLLTTRDTYVAKQCNDIPHSLKYLTADESWILLEKKVFHGKKCPIKLEQLGKSIAEKCKGLPIAIVLIAGALMGKYKTTREWEQVDQNVGEYLINVDSMNFKKLVQMSFDRLPCELKACFLYFGGFPRGFEIPSWKLIRLWIAEGLIQYKGNLPLEFKAEDCLNDLVTRSLVTVIQMTSDGKIKTCCVHDMLYEFCKQEAMNEENLFLELNLGVGQSFPGKRELSSYRRLSIHSSVMEFISTFPTAEHVRSFLCFSSNKIEIPLALIPAIPACFPLLRVLDVESIKFSRFPKEFSLLYHLRYLAVSSDTIKILPKHLGNLWNIQTLIVHTQQPTLDIQADIWNMPRLRHLHTNSSATLPMHVSRRSSKVTRVNHSLQTLSTIAPESCTGEVFARVPNLQKLGIRGELGAALFDSISKLQYLENLKLINDGCQIEHWCLPPAYVFPGKLRKLTLFGTLFKWHDMSVLGQLEYLEVLKLKENAFKGKYWEPVVGGFSSLLVLWIERTELASWNAAAVHFPRLQRLVLISCHRLEEIPIALADISSLQEMELQNSVQAAKSARSIQAKKDKQLQEGAKSIGFKLSIFPPDL